jgi:hypothetical protein
MIEWVRLFAVTFALYVTAITIPAHAALVTQINGLNIDGQLYDVTFHAGASFNDLWDSNVNQTFGDDTSLFNAAPTFWGNETAANHARDAIMSFLGSADTTTGFGDGFRIPFAFSGGTDIFVTQDQYLDPALDTAYTAIDFQPGTASNDTPYASFVLAAPVPPAAWLFASGLCGLIGAARRKVSR